MALLQSGQLSVGELVRRAARDTRTKVEQVRRRWREFYRELHRADLLLLRAAGVQPFPTRNIFIVTSDRKTTPLVNKH